MVRSIIWCVVFSAAFRAAAAGVELTLPQACEEAARNNPGLKSWAYALESARGGVVSASVRENPELSFAPGLKHVKGGDTALHFDADLSVPLGLQEKRDAARAVADGGVSLQGAGLDAARRQLRLDVTKTFARILAEQRIAVLRREQVEAAKLFFEAAQHRVKSGLASELETARSEADVVAARKALRAAEGAAAAARVELCALMGRPPTGEIIVAGSLDVPVSGLAATQLVAAATARSANLALLAKQAEVAELQLRATRLETKPTYTIGPNLEYTEEEQVIGFSISRPLFWWDKKTGAILTAAAEQQKALAEIDKAKAEMAGGIAAAATRFDAARDAAALYTPDFLARLKSAVAQAEGGYAANSVPLLVFLDARKTYFDTLGEYYETLAEVTETRAELEQAMGCSMDEITKTGNQQ